MALRPTRALGVLALLLCSGCASLVNTAVALPFEVGRHAQALTVANIEGGMKIAEETISLIDHAGQAIHQHQMRRAELNERIARARYSRRGRVSRDDGQSASP